jgi:hypothetical protein
MKPGAVQTRQRALGKLTPVEYELAFTPLPSLDDHEQAA